MKNKAHKIKTDEDLKAYTKEILEQKQLENSALKKILEFLENENKKLKTRDKNNDN